jgi:hypothetical protein
VLDAVVEVVCNLVLAFAGPNLDVRQQACEALSSIVGEADVHRQRTVDANALAALAVAMRVPTARDGAPIAACDALCDVIGFEQAHIQKAVDEGALSAAVAVMRAREDMGMRMSVCRALACIASGTDGIEQAVVDAGALPVIVMAMGAHRDSSHMQGLGRTALQFIAAGG